jgi:hypothetical protein
MPIAPRFLLILTIACARAEDTPPLSAPSATDSAAASAPAARSDSPPITAPPTAGTAERAAPVPRKTFEHDGQTFELANSTTAKNVETDEYVVAGEKIADWSQVVTVQRLTMAQPTPSDEFLAYFQKRLNGEDGANLEILRQAKRASIFTVRFPKSEQNEEQIMICLAFADPAKPSVLNIVQYALKPSRVSANLAEMRMKSWRDKFLTQAQALPL